MEIYLSSLDDLNERAKREHDAQHFLPDKNLENIKKLLLHDLLCAAGLADNVNPIKLNVVYNKDVLKNFSAVCIQNRVKIQELFGENVRSDVKANPAQQVGRVLELIGLKAASERKKVNGAITTHYMIIPEFWHEIQELIQKRANEVVKKIPFLNAEPSSKLAHSKLEKEKADRKHRSTVELKKIEKPLINP